jgi:hypothetical protein
MIQVRVDGTSLRWVTTAWSLGYDGVVVADARCRSLYQRAAAATKMDR